MSSQANIVLTMHDKHKSDSDSIDFNHEAIVQFNRYRNKAKALKNCMRLGWMNSEIEDHLNQHIASRKKAGRIQGTVHFILEFLIASPFLALFLSGGAVFGFLALLSIIGSLMFVI